MILGRENFTKYLRNLGQHLRLCPVSCPSLLISFLETSDQSSPAGVRRLRHVMRTLFKFIYIESASDQVSCHASKRSSLWQIWFQTKTLSLLTLYKVISQSDDRVIKASPCSMPIWSAVVGRSEQMRTTRAQWQVDYSGT